MSFEWHARYHQDALDGMLMLTLEERGAYNTLLDLIYTRAGPVPDDERWLAGWMGCSVKKWRLVRFTLLVKAKIYECEHNGQPGLMNERAELEIASASSRRRVAVESGATGGRKSAENRQKSSKNNGRKQATLEGSLKLRTETLQITPDDPNGSSPPHIETTPTKAKTRNDFLPASWVVSEDLYGFGEARGMARKEIDDAADEFRDYWGSRRDTKAKHANWDLTFRVRLRDVADRLNRNRPRLVASSGQSGGGGRGAVSFADIYARRHGQASD